ncbi:LysR family transcriptional regulator [Neobacillus sp. OS1-32]|uniref:LysR family transcriptional regulator n=1 Tax=Neobacillus sp. OS1-32 TaxID=3070682 RepID=UPI0027E1118D|nr:LysR family transcriptional regulator [Neobacillus sp. OS1-32]WML31775.1 LysR family transcriptional regulator [Neobacillus sp. OS1-32]
MDLKQLRYFSTIAQEGQITRAAKKLHMAQPPLSQQLKLLEQELGVTLLERNGKTIELTEAGKILFEKSQDLLQRFEDTVSEVKEVGDGLKGLLSIGSVKTCFSFIPERIKFFRERYPLVTIRLHEGDSSLLASYVRNRDVELAIVRLPLDLNDFSVLSLPKDRFVLVIPETWSNVKKMKLEEIADLPLMLLHRIKGVGLFELVINRFRSRDLIPNVVCQCPDAAMLLSLVRAEVGAAILPKYTLLSFPTNQLKVIEIEDSAIESESAVIWLKDRYLSKSALRFIETFQKQLSEDEQT